MKNLFLKKGLYQESTSDNNMTYLGKGKGLFDMFKWIKRALSRLNVPFIDNCCLADSSEQQIFPVRYNETLGILQTYNPETGTWVEVEVGGEVEAPQWFGITEDSEIEPTTNYVLADAVGGDIIITLPTPSNAIGVYNIKKIDNTSNTITFSEPLDGDSAFELNSQWESVSFMSDGSNYYIL